MPAISRDCFTFRCCWPVHLMMLGIALPTPARFPVDAVGRLLHMAHLRQRFPLWQPLPTSTRNNAQNNDGFREDSGVGDDSQAQQGRRLFSASSARRAHKTRVSGHLLARASVLGTILPESMVCTLEYTNSKFARTLLGNADTLRLCGLHQCV